MQMSDSSYSLLKDVHEAVARLEAKMDSRINNLEHKTDKLESKLDGLLGRMAVGAALGMLFLGTAVSYIFDIFKTVIEKR